VIIFTLYFEGGLIPWIHHLLRPLCCCCRNEMASREHSTSQQLLWSYHTVYWNNLCIYGPTI